MLIVIAFALAGAAWGARVARSRGGNGLDMAQYGAGYGIAFAIAGLVLAIILARLG
jgi:hypothetical protein